MLLLLLLLPLPLGVVALLLLLQLLAAGGRRQAARGVLPPQLLQLTGRVAIAPAPPRRAPAVRGGPRRRRGHGVRHPVEGADDSTKPGARRRV